ncbi:hypothetical protein GCM10010465_27380 [Actinomadura fibrosa]
MILIFLVIGCKNEEKNKTGSPPEPVVEEPAESLSLSKYISEKWHFSISFPEDYRVLEGKLPGDSPVINIYDPETGNAPPYAIHEEPGLSYVAFLPQGFGVDAPSGKRLSFKEWEKNLPLSFNIDLERSTVYLLKNGEPWALDLRFHQPPPGWGDYGSIFVHYAVKNFSAQCFDSSGNEKPMRECEPMGPDRVEYSGEVISESKNALNAVLESLEFNSDNTQKREISDLIKVEQPMPNIEVSSPLVVEGKARGYWFFEGDAPIKLVDKDQKVLATGYIEAQGEWMTEDFVPFRGEIRFTAPDDESGYLVLERANASGKPEHDRVYRLPVLFPSNN